MGNSALSNIKLLITDVDGVMTDGGMYFSGSGEEMKRFSSKDGMAVNICRQHNIQYGIISAGHHEGLVLARARVLKIEHVYVGKEAKLDVLNRWLEEQHLALENVAYIGDDLNDIPIMKAAGFSACPANAVEAVKQIADLVLKTDGGHGCVREFVDNHLVPAIS